MTATTLDTSSVPARRTRPASAGPTFPRLVAAEWIKLWSLRSTVWTLASTVVAMVGITFLVAWSTSQMTDPTQEAAELGSAASVVTLSYFFGQLALAVLGVLAISGEYSTGMIRSTFAAAPRRLPALWAKALVTTVVGAAVGAVSVGLSTLVAMPFFDRLGVALDLTDGQTLRVLGGAVLYLATLTLLALAIGALLRHSAAAIATVLGLLLVIETVFMSIPHTFFSTISPFLPGTAGSRIMLDDEGLEMAAMMSDATQLTPWQGYGVMVAWVVVLLGAAAVLMRRRDA